ncbi:hypothetical protein CMUS01_09390 [Colletotrichum musicola]|uniref:Aldos-2-ulose dehydratase/isomerase (AUDH) Cupin domain-containing protein n=1 Tax=Colletotrichum musicola TaxID=2175873 RepID=A0A8H6K853_9PEZI|nr:hypothetical protein CMUS01_09390 [Colletotrichum musicola]
MASNELAVPSFAKTIIENDRKDGYWVETFHFANGEVPGLLASGLASGDVEFLENPVAAAKYRAQTAGEEFDPSTVNISGEWKKHLIAKFSGPVAVVTADITNNGLTDVIVCHDYGPFMLECDPKGGWISWLENPGREKLGDGEWVVRTIGRWPAMHRLKVGHFTQKSLMEIVAASVVYGPRDKTTPVPIIRFQAPEKPLEATEWDRSIIDDENFTVIHEVTTKKFNGPSGLDSMLIASREGATWLYYENGSWHRQLLSAGEPKEDRQLPNSLSPGTGDHWGTGNSDAGQFGDDPFAYIATMDPFHGTTACVLSKVGRGMKESKWKRHILDVYGTPNQLMKYGDGPGHFVVCADFDGDGDDEFLIAMLGSLNRDDKMEAIQPEQKGPNPNKGVVYYKAIDVDKGLFAKWKVAEESAARIAIGDFTGNGKLDFIAVEYNVPLYYEEPKPVIHLYENKFARPKPAVTERHIVPTLWDKEGMIYLARPDEIKNAESLPLIEVANYALSVEIHAPGSKIPLGEKDGIKVLYGSVASIEGTRYSTSVPAFPQVGPTTSDDRKLSADKERGAILLRIVSIDEPGEWEKTEDVPVKTTFDTKGLGIEFPELKFIKVDQLWWGDQPQFRGVDFTNLTGFHFRFQDDKTQIAHLQFWTAGPNVDCGVHNHGDDIFQEIHICLSPGTGNGGMWRLKDGKKPEGAGPDDFDKLPLPRLYEHGGLWDRDSYGHAVRGKNNIISYPWHKWQGGTGKNLDVWLALEFNPDLVRAQGY